MLSVVCLLALVFVAICQSHRSLVRQSPKPYSPFNYKGAPVCNGQFMCKVQNKFSKPTCLCANQVCDGVKHCLGGEDELTCNKPFSCPAGQYRCKNEQKCISLNKVCDEMEDCLNGDDEEGCDFSCPAGQYRCKNEQKCISLNKVCDEMDDCFNGDDEEGCDRVCEDFWIPFQGSCYHLGGSNDFDNAVQYCTDLNSSMVEFNNEEEYTFLNYITPIPCVIPWWIGLTDRNDPGNWTLLSSGEVPEFTDWFSPEEQNDADQDCAVVEFKVSLNKWYMTSLSCSILFPTICEK